MYSKRSMMTNFLVRQHFFLTSTKNFQVISLEWFLENIFNTNQFESNRIKYYFIVRPKVDQRAGQLCLPHIVITKTEKNRTKHTVKTDKLIQSPMTYMYCRTYLGHKLLRHTITLACVS